MTRPVTVVLCAATLITAVELLVIWTSDVVGGGTATVETLLVLALDALLVLLARLRTTAGA